MTANQTIKWQKRQAKKRERRARRLQKRGKKNMSDAARLYRVVFKHILGLMPPDMLAENCITLAIRFGYAHYRADNRHSQEQKRSTQEDCQCGTIRS